MKTKWKSKNVDFIVWKPLNEPIFMIFFWKKTIWLLYQTFKVNLIKSNRAEIKKSYKLTIIIRMNLILWNIPKEGMRKVLFGRVHQRLNHVHQPNHSSSDQEMNLTEYNFQKWPWKLFADSIQFLCHYWLILMNFTQDIFTFKNVW